ncbi:MAG: right-handed parallel beta-helix repeat-containing protein [Pyrinomonadaceae bacterium]|nr:right-handed parallel beta-helix repeat-containing protein [Pyrinomonadaceae bacterium]
MKRLEKPNWQKENERKKTVWLVLLGVLVMVPLLIGAAFVFGNAASEDDSAVFTSELEVSGNRIFVKAGGNFQAALDRAKAGDTIVLEAGAKFVGAFVLPNKTGGEFITIQSSEIAKLPKDGERVGLKDAASMPKILSSGKGKPAIETAPGAHHYRFVGIEFAPANNDYIYNLIYLGAEKLADVPHHIEIDRCYLRSNLPGITRRGIALNSAETIIKNSYLAGFAGAGEETQGICGWSGTKNVKIINNYIEAGAENIMFGGSDPATAELIPADIEVRGNHLNKPAEWKGKYTLKCLFELKNAKRVNFVGNYLENNWEGSAFRITVRNQDGKAPFSTIEDVTVKDNIVVNAGAGINILGSDDTHPSQPLKRLTIANNLFLEIDGYFIQISGGEDVSIFNNTSFDSGFIASIHGGATKNFLFRDNIVAHGEYGIHGFTKDIKSIEAQRTFQNNVIVNNKKIPMNYGAFPPNNFWIQDFNAVGFQNFAQKDFRLAPKSRFKGKGKDGGDIGSNLTLDSPAK